MAVSTRNLVLLMLACAMGAPGWAQTPERPPAVRNAEQCLRDHVAAVLAAEPDAGSAATLLVDYICAREVRAAARFRRNTALAGRFNAGMAAIGVNAPNPRSPPPDEAWVRYRLSVDPVTGEIAYPPQTDGVNPGIWAFMSLQISVRLGGAVGDFEPVPAELRALAGELVMQARH